MMKIMILQNDDDNFENDEYCYYDNYGKIIIIIKKIKILILIIMMVGIITIKMKRNIINMIKMIMLKR